MTNCNCAVRIAMFANLMTFSSLHSTWEGAACTVNHAVSCPASWRGLLCCSANCLHSLGLRICGCDNSLLSQVAGSIYIPEVNYIMMVLTVIVVAVFRTTVQLGNAYGRVL